MKILLRLARPLSPVKDVVVSEMPDRDLCAKEGMMAPIKRQQSIGRPVAGFVTIGFQDEVAHPGRAESLALQRQEREFGHGVEGPEFPVELQAVNDHRLSLKADVL